MKCGECAHGFHGDCQRPSDDAPPMVDEDLLPLCCCHDLGLWFDADGIERWPNGDPYPHEGEHSEQ